MSLLLATWWARCLYVGVCVRVRVRAVVGTTKYSEQNHNPKEKEFKLKENSRLKSHEPFSESEFPSIFGPVPGAPHPFGQAGGCGEFALRAHYYPRARRGPPAGGPEIKPGRARPGPLELATSKLECH